MTPEEENIVVLQVEIDVLQAKLDKKREVNRSDETLNTEVIYAKQHALDLIMEATI
jgi:hypothetical protein